MAILPVLDFTQGSATIESQTSFVYGKTDTLTSGKFNNDERNDLATISPESDILQVFLNYGDRTVFQQVYSTGSHPTSVIRINFNNDSIDDLAVLTCNQTITIYLGTNLGIFQKSDVLFYVDNENNNNDECAHSLKVVDLNQDGKDDLVFVNPSTESVKVFLGNNCDDNNI